MVDTTSVSNAQDERATEIWNEESVKELTDNWSIYWNLLKEDIDSPEKLHNASAQLLKPQSSLMWANQKILANGEEISSSGYATYLLNLEYIPANQEGWVIDFAGIDGAARASLVDASYTLIAQSEIGVFSLEASQPSKKRLRLFIPGMKDIRNAKLYVEIVNHDLANPGIWLTPKLMSPSKLSKLDLQSSVGDFVTLGVAISVGIYGLFMFIRRQEDKSSLALFAFSSSLCLRVISTSSNFATLLDSQGAFLYRLEFFSIAAMCASLYFFIREAYFPSKMRELTFYFIGSLCLLTIFSFLIFFTLLSKALLVYQLYAVTSFLCFITLLVKAIKGKQCDAIWILIGVGVGILASTYDIVAVNIIKNYEFPLTPFGSVVFLLLQSQVIARRAAVAYRQAEYFAKEVVEKEKARTLFFHNTSHELRTPLNGIVGYLDLIRQGRYGDISDTAIAQIDKALRLAESLKTQVNTILDLAKSKRGELEIYPTCFSLKELKKEADGLAEGLCLKSAEMSYSSTDSWEDDSFISDKDKIFTILRNLLGNAFKFHKAEGFHYVSLQIRRDEKNLSITVEDSGIGIPESQREKIFEEFGQIDGDARRNYEGSGLGLSMVKNLVSLLNGSIYLESKPGVGSVFTVTVPTMKASDIRTDTSHYDERSFCQEPNMRINHSDNNGNSFQSQGNMDSHSILVIDDNETNCEVISEILKTDGHELTTAVSASVGLDIMRNARPDLLLLDMMMPEMSGEDVIKIMKQDPLLQDIPVILITARASDEDRILGLQMGADDYLPKPIFAAELRLRVHNLLSRLQLLRDIENGSKDEKFAQLGSLFGELSHELKNVMVGTASLRGINPNDSKSLVEALGLSKKSAKALSKALMAPLSSKDRSELLERLDPGADDELRQQRWMLRFDVTDLDLNFEQLEPLWNELKELHSEKMLLAISTIKLFTEHKILHEQMRMARDITTSVLNYTRDDSGHVTCCIDKVWTDITRLTQNKQRKTKAKIDVQIPESTIVPMRYSSCMQVLLNLTMNALDAVAEIDEMNERWIKLQAYQDESGVFLQISNAGKPIPKETQKQLFERGFSTKGDSGNGIGLYVSRRLMKDTGGELSYDEYSQSPCFKLFFPMDEQAASQMSLTSAVADSLAS